MPLGSVCGCLKGMLGPLRQWPLKVCGTHRRNSMQCSAAAGRLACLDAAPHFEFSSCLRSGPSSRHKLVQSQVVASHVCCCARCCNKLLIIFLIAGWGVWPEAMAFEHSDDDRITEQKPNQNDDGPAALSTASAG
jgi:hypothetical protein